MLSSLAQREFDLADEAATLALGAALAQVVGPGLIALRGELGAGKTTLVRGLLRGLGFKGRVKSPTYTLVEPYPLTPFAVSHWDLYRLGSAEELDAIGARESARADELMLVEWPERAGSRMQSRDLEVELGYADAARRVRLSAHTARGRDWLQRLDAKRELLD